MLGPKLSEPGETYALPSEHWPTWGHSSTQFERMWLYCPDADNPVTSKETTAAVVGRLMTERHDVKDEPRPYNYNFYLVVESTDGRAFQSGPMRTSDVSHHSSQPHAILDGYDPPPL